MDVFMMLEYVSRADSMPRSVSTANKVFIHTSNTTPGQSCTFSYKFSSSNSLRKWRLHVRESRMYFGCHEAKRATKPGWEGINSCPRFNPGQENKKSASSQRSCCAVLAKNPVQSMMLPRSPKRQRTRTKDSMMPRSPNRRRRTNGILVGRLFCRSRCSCRCSVVCRRPTATTTVLTKILRMWSSSSPQSK